VGALAGRARRTLPVCVDPVRSADTRHLTGDLVPDRPIDRTPNRNDMPRIEPQAPG